MKTNVMDDIMEIIQVIPILDAVKVRGCCPRCGTFWDTRSFAVMSKDGKDGCFVSCLKCNYEMWNLEDVNGKRYLRHRKLRGTAKK